MRFKAVPIRLPTCPSLRQSEIPETVVGAAGVYARTAFKGLARALGTMVRLDCLAAQNAHLPHAFAMFKRYACDLQYQGWCISTGTRYCQE